MPELIIHGLGIVLRPYHFLAAFQETKRTTNYFTVLWSMDYRP